MRNGPKNAKAFVVEIALALVALAIVVGGFVTSHAVEAALGIVSGFGLALLGQVLRRPAAIPNRRTNAIAGAVGVVVLPAIGLVFGPGAKDGTATFVAGLMLPVLAFLVAAALVAGAKDPDFWHR